MVTGSKPSPMPAYVKPQSSFFDQSFDTKILAECILILKLDFSSIDLTVFHHKKNKFIVLESYRISGVSRDDELFKEIELLIKDQSWLSRKFKKVKIIYGSVTSTLVPESLYDNNDQKLYLDFNLPESEKQDSFYDNLPNASAINVYALPENLTKIIINTWPDSTIYHSSSIFIESLLIKFRNKQDNKSVYVQLDDTAFDLVYIKDGKLFYHNTFKHKTKEDFIYFLLTAIDKLRLNPEDINLVMCGLFDKSNIYYDIVYQYIRNISFIERNNTFTYSYRFEKLPLHKFYILFNALLCE